jgi:NB-ARC domain
MQSLGWGYTQYIDARDKSYEAAISQLITSLKRILAASSIPREEAVTSILATAQKEDVPHRRLSEHLQPVGILQQTLQDWSDAPDVSTFFGRTEELSTLEQWIIKERCRLIAIVGIKGIGKTSISIKLGRGGIGKTDLSLKLAQELQEHFEYIIWRKLINAPKLVDIIADLIKVLSKQQDINLPATADEQISKLLFYLREHRCLLILDNAETLLQGGQYAGQYREGYENYGQLFRAIAEVPHQSCLLLTSREKPKEVARLEGKTRPVRSLPLSGLDHIDCQKIFEAFGTFSGLEEEWRELNDFYNGNPLALELAARHIEEVFYGSISDFLREGKQVFTENGPESPVL